MPRTSRCPRCCGPLVRDLDGPACIACGHVPLTAAEQARVPALAADVAADNYAAAHLDQRHGRRSRNVHRPGRATVADVLALVEREGGTTRNAARRELGNGAPRLLEELVETGQLVREEQPFRGAGGVRFWYRPASVVAEG